MRRRNFLKTVAATAAWTSVGSSIAIAQSKKLRIGFVINSPVDLEGWGYQHNLGRLAIEKEFGDKVETSVVENVPEGPDAERVIQQLAQSGYDMIFTPSFGYMNPTIKVAKRFPQVKFEQATGYKRAPNVSTYTIRFYEARYVSGVMAGSLTKTNTVGYISTFAIPEVLRSINAAYLGAKSVNPDVIFKIIWINTWFDPGKEADAATALIDQGADIIMQHSDSPAPMRTAEAKGVRAFGHSSDLSTYGPEAHIVSLQDNWGPYYVQRVKAALDGTWESTDDWFGLKDDAVIIGPFNKNLPTDVVEKSKTIVSAIASGSLHPFAGPINFQDGSTWVAEGSVAPDGDLLGMDFYVEGLQGALPTAN